MPRKPLLNECQSLFAAPVGRLPLSKYFLHVLHRCVPGFGPFAINVALVVAAAIFIEPYTTHHYHCRIGRIAKRAGR
jgi:hypothetical protein